MSRKREPLSAEMQDAQTQKLQDDKNFLNEVTQKMEENQQTAQPENNNTTEVIFENETPLIFNFIQFVKGEAHKLRFVGIVCHELDNICQSTGITKSQLHTILIIDGLKKYNKNAQTLSLLYRNQEADRAKIRAYYKALKVNCNQ